MKRILVIGSSGQLGSELVLFLRARYVASEVVAGYVGGALPCESILLGGPCVELDVRDVGALSGVVRRYNIDTIYNLASLLSVVSDTHNPHPKPQHATSQSHSPSSHHQVTLNLI